MNKLYEVAELVLAIHLQEMAELTDDVDNNRDKLLEELNAIRPSTQSLGLMLELEPNAKIQKLLDDVIALDSAVLLYLDKGACFEVLEALNKIGDEL